MELPSQWTFNFDTPPHPIARIFNWYLIQYLSEMTLISRPHFDYIDSNWQNCIFLLPFDSQLWPSLTFRQNVGHSDAGKNGGYFQIDKNRKRRMGTEFAPTREYQKLITITSDSNLATKNRPNGPQGWPTLYIKYCWGRRWTRRLVQGGKIN